MSGTMRIPADTLAQQSKASDPSGSAWVSAHAGSGKTHVLAQRVIRLLLDGTDPSRILCLTYTRAAAANMANRVFASLSAWAVMEDRALRQAIAELDGRHPSPERLMRARQLFARSLETPGGLKIQTIHAFCEAVLQQFPLEANIAGHFELLDPQMEAALIGEARRAMIAVAADGGDAALAEAFAQVLERGGESGLESLLREIVRQRDALRGFTEAIGEGDQGFEALFAVFDLGADDDAGSLAKPVWPDPYFDKTLAQGVIARASAAGKSTALDFGHALLAASNEVEAERLLPALRSACMTRKQGQWAARSASRIMAKGVREHFPEFEEEFDRFTAVIGDACDRLEILEMVRATRAALIMADWLIGRYERLKTGRGFLDFNDLISRTAALLSRHDAAAWVHYKLDQGIDHILLDEAQDTSPHQWSVVAGLTAEFFAGKGQREGSRRTIFAVGDEKQSIYSFQGAAPEAFYTGGMDFQSRVRAAGERFEMVRLNRSFRSTEDVLSAVDLVFARDAARQGLTRDPETIIHTTVREADPGCVELWPSLGSQEVEEPDDWTRSIDHASAPAVRLAELVAETVARWLQSGEMIEGKGRALSAGDVMVLVRKRDSFVHALSRALKKRQVPVAGTDRLVLADHIAVKDLAAIGRFVLQSDDDLSLAAALKSPALGLDEDALLELASGRPDGRSLFVALSARAEPGTRYGSAHERLTRWRNEAGYKKAFEFYADLLGRDGVRREMIARLGHEAGDILDEFLNFCLAAEKSGSPDLESLLALLEGGGPDIKRELDQPRGELRIMTAHASKGLEAPVVFLVDSGGAPFHDSHLPLLMPFDPPDRAWPVEGLLWRFGGGNANSVMRRLCEGARARAEEEYRRLLYVGMTRAEDRLIVCGYHGKTGQKDVTWHALVRDALVASERTQEAPHPVSAEPMLVYRVNAPRSVAGQAPQVDKQAVAPLPRDLLVQMPPAPALERPLSPSGAAAIIDPDREPMGGAGSPVLSGLDDKSPAIQRGIAAHRLLQLLPDLAESEREAAAGRYIARIGRDWPSEERTRLWSEVRAILSDERFGALFSSNSRAEVEVMGTLRIGNTERAVAGKIDRIAVGAREVLVVDYKTNRPPPAALDQVPFSHVAQLALYRDLLRPLYPNRPVTVALLYTAGPTLLPVPAAALDDALARLARS